MGQTNLVEGKKYILRITTQEVECEILKIHNVLDASSLTTTKNKQVELNDVAEITIRTKHPVAFDLYKNFEDTGRFVLIENYDVSGGGIIMQPMHKENEMLLEVARRRDLAWIKSKVSVEDRILRNGHREGIILFTGDNTERKTELASKLELALFKGGRNAYLLDSSNLKFGLDADISGDDAREVVRRFGETAHLLMQAGLVVISTANTFTSEDHQSIKTLVHPSPTLTIQVSDPDIESSSSDTDIEISDEKDNDVVIKKIMEKLHDKNILF